LVAVDGFEEHIRTGDSFVEDTTCGETNNDPAIEPTRVEVDKLTESEEKLVTRMQVITKFSLDFIKVTGIDLELLQPHKQHKFISLLSRANGSTSGIKRKTPEEGHISLGFHMAGDRTSSAHKKTTSEKAFIFGESIMGSSLWRSEIAVA
jgi:hypothetical protein